MRLTVINGSPRNAQKSNTASIINAFLKGYTKSGNTAQVFHLSNRSQWEDARNAFDNELILIAFPLYVENLPGIMLEFLETVKKKQNSGTKIAFLLQSGFPEACQRRCAERYLEELPARLGCEFVGTLSRGDLFGVNLIGGKMSEQMLLPFEDMGRLFAEHNSFLFPEAAQFTGDEYMPEKTAKKFERIGKHFQKFFMNRIAKKLGCKDKLDAKPYRG